MFFDFGDGHPDLEHLPRALSPREGAFVAIIVHLLVIILVLVVPRTEWAKNRAKEAEAARLAALERSEATRIEPFMIVQPRLDVEAPKPPPRAPLSDKDRMAMARERPPNPINQQPFSRGNTRQPEEASPPSTAPPPGAPPAPPPPAGTDGERDSTPRQAEAGYVVPERGAGGQAPPADRTMASRIPPGTPRALADALGNLSRYIERSGAQLDNPNGGGQYGQSFQFDTKGVDFGAWLRAFKAQVMRNWLIPQAAYFLRGRVSLTMVISRNGAISELQVVDPSNVEGFTHAAYNALAASNPTAPLPQAYPDQSLRMRVTFFYNEEPPSPIP
jgi:TonB family protein